MIEFFARHFPNVVDFRAELWKAIGETLIMVSISGAASLLLGLLLGIVLVTTTSGGLYENRLIYAILDKVINAFRSVPFVILIALMIPITRFLVGTSILVPGAIPPLVVGIVPFISRVIEQALLEVDHGMIEAARAMGISKSYIIIHIYLRESLPGIVRAGVLSLISLIGLSAMSGAVGGGGIGSFATRYGYARYMMDITVVTVLLLLGLVTVLQSLGNWLAKRLTH